jgi:hypothetical protein
MKRVIELLNEAYHALAINHEDAEALAYIDKAIAELKTPCWETPEQWEKRTGKKWPDNWPVFFEYGENTHEWYVDLLKRVKHERVIKIGRIYIFTEAGPPPADWKLEETMK